MKHALLLIAICCLPSIALAQQRYAQPKGEYDVAFKLPHTLDKSSITDTIFTPIFADPCADTLTTFILNPPNSGYVIGTNSFNDILQLQRMTYDSPDGSPFFITEVGFTFVDYDTLLVDTELTAEIRPDLTTADSSLNDALGVSDPVLVEDVVLPLTGIAFTRFFFPEPVRVDTNSFLIGLNLSDTYTAGTDTSYVGLFTTRNNCGNGANVIQISSTGSGTLPPGSIDQFYNLNIEMIVYAIIETEDPSSNRRPPLADYRARISPNPAMDRVAVTLDAGKTGDYTATLTDLTGRQLRHQVFGSRQGALSMDWPVNDLTAGLYLIHIDGPDGRQSRRLVVH